LFKGNECVSVAVYCNCMAEKNFYFTEALFMINKNRKASYSKTQNKTKMF